MDCQRKHQPRIGDDKDHAHPLAGALLVILWWRRGRLEWRRDVLPLTPWFALGAAAGLLTAWIERRLLGAEGMDFDLNLLQRGLLAGRAFWFDLGKLLWPVGLTFIYPRWTIAASAWPQGLYALAALALLGGCWMVRGRSRAPLAVWLLFVGSLFPVLGFFNVFPFVFSFVADHFLYLPSLAIIAALAAGATVLRGRLSAETRWVGPACSAALLGTLGANPGCYLCLNDLGTLSFEAGELDKATEEFTRALEVKADSAEAHNNLGDVLVQSGSLSDAIAHYELSLKAAPRNVSTHTNLGSALVLVGRIPEAKTHFETALRIMPGYAPARQKLAVIESLPDSRTPDIGARNPA